MNLITFFSLAILVTVVCVNGQDVPPYTEDCRHGMYQTHARSIGSPPLFQVNLDMNPMDRWTEVVQHKQNELKGMIQQFKNFLNEISPALVNALEKYLPDIIGSLPPPYNDEVVGIAKASGLPQAEVLLFNIFYEVSSLCTSLVAQDTEGNLYHARNMDFGLAMGWDAKNHSWIISEYLRPLLVDVEFVRGGKTVYKAVTFAGYVGIITGLKPGVFSLALNARSSKDNGLEGILDWILGDRTGQWTSFLSRDAMEQATSYDHAVQILSKDEIFAPVYYIVGGSKSGQGCVITRERKSVASIISLDLPAGKWYVVQTNYDNWTEPPFYDNRRKPAKKCLDETGQKNIGFSTIYDVLSTKPVLNLLTTHTALMNVKNGTLEAYLRVCESPCWPW